MLITASNRLSRTMTMSAMLAGAILLFAGPAFAAGGNGKDKGGGKGGAGRTEQSSSAAASSSGPTANSNANGNAFGKGPKPTSERPGKPFAYGVHDCRGGGCKGPLPGTNPPPGPGTTTALAGLPNDDICGYYEIRGMVLYSRWVDASAVPDRVRRVRCR